MNDERFERSLRSTLATDAPAAAPASLHDAVSALDDVAVRRARGGVRGRLFERISALGLVAAVVVVAVVALAASRGIPGTGVGGLGAAPTIRWASPYASLTATGFWIETGGVRFVGAGSVDVHSDPGDPHYRTLEMTWLEQGVEMRLFIYFAADSTDWWVSEMRTYDGRPAGEWAYYEGPLFRTPIGQAYHGDVDLVSNRTDSIPGHLHIDGLTLSAFGLMANASPGANLNGNGAGVGPNGGPIVTELPNGSGPAAPTPATAGGSGPSSTSVAASAVAHATQPPGADAPDVATVRDLVTTFEQNRAQGRWQAAWDVLSPWQQKELPLAAASTAWRGFSTSGGDVFAITQVTSDWTVLNYAYAGAIENDVRAYADASRALAVWVDHPGINAVSAGREGLLVAPMSDGSGWRIWVVH